MDTNLYWTLRGGYAKRKSILAEVSREWLEACILDGEYNDFLSKYADDEDKNKKRVPYMGWFWRHLEFSDGKLPLGFSYSGYNGFMTNNKWDYPERYTTPEEFAKIMELIDAAMEANQQGGNLKDIIASTEAVFDELNTYVQSLKFETK